MNNLIYTYHIPYGIRREICNLLDADQSWRTLGGQFFNLNVTQLTLLGQAHMRNSSPTSELLNKLDSANIKISEFCFYLKQMNHFRALELLKPCLNQINQQIESFVDQESMLISKNSTTLDTPTPSFDQLPAALMPNYNLNSAEFQINLLSNLEQQQQLQPAYNDAQRLNQINLLDNKLEPNNQNHLEQVQIKCHKTQSGKRTDINDEQKLAKSINDDPGEEIVRMACTNNRKRTSISDQEVVNQLRLIMQITYNELKQASDNFSNLNILGNGGFASVYRGNWKGTDVAIKRLNCNLMDQALNELTILNSYRIDNILPIYGISIDGPEACLVYQFMSNGSLEDRLSCKKNTLPLSWSQRALIGEGVAKGLYYLHTLRDKPLVHGDVKSANVLLDSQLQPKLGDFGLARQVFKGKNPQTELCTHCTVSSIHGTSVYLPPEYLRHKILSPAVDVYSYGIVLLEMATGKRAYDGKRLLIDLVEDETKSISKGQIGYSLKDPRLDDDTQDGLKIWYELLIKMGLQCAHKIKKKRLDMGQVLSRFAEFKNIDSTAANISTTPPNGNLTFNNNYNKSMNTAATAKTATPDNPNGNQVNETKNRLVQNSSSLMIVEEEDVEDSKKSDHNNVKQKLDNEVEAMIPNFELIM